MVIKRDSYLQKIYSKKGNGKVKIMSLLSVYLKDIVERHKLKDDTVLESVVHRWCKSK